MREGGLVQLVGDMIRIPSVTGSEKELALFLQQTMQELGYDEAWVDGTGNVVGRIRGGGRHRLLFDAHIDTVGEGDRDRWSVDPFGGTVSGGKIYGRGVADMKASLGAMIWAGAGLLERRDRLPGDIYISGTVSEEIAEGCSIGTVLDRVRPDYVVIGEASELNVKIGQRGRAEIVVESRGKSSHSSSPRQGINAAENLLDLARGIRELALPDDPLLGEAILVLTDIISRPYPGMSVIPYQARATYDRRTLTGETEESVLGQIRDLARDLGRKDPSLDLAVSLAEEEVRTWTGETLRVRRFFPAWQIGEDHPLCAGTRRAMQAAGLSPGITAYRFCTNGSTTAGRRRIPTIGYGPGCEEMAHVVDENVPVAEIEEAVEGYRAIMTHEYAEEVGRE